MHEDTMQTERTPALDAVHVKKLFVLLLISMGLSFADTMQTERTPALDAVHVALLLLISIGLSFAAHVRSLCQSIEAYRNKVARRDAPRGQVLKLIKAAPAGQSKRIEAACTDQSNQVEQLGRIDAANTSQSKHIEAARAGSSRQIEQPGLITWPRGRKLGRRLTAISLWMVLKIN